MSIGLPYCFLFSALQALCYADSMSRVDYPGPSSNLVLTPLQALLPPLLFQPTSFQSVRPPQQSTTPSGLVTIRTFRLRLFEIQTREAASPHGRDTCQCLPPLSTCLNPSFRPAGSAPAKYRHLITPNICHHSYLCNASQHATGLTSTLTTDNCN